MTKTVRTSDYLGGRAVLGAAAESLVELSLAVRRGLPSASLDCTIHRLAPVISLWAIYTLIGNARTLRRRRRAQTVLARGESDRLARLARIAALASNTLGGAEKGHRWLAEPNAGLGGASPIALLHSDPATTLVATALERVARGSKV